VETAHQRGFLAMTPRLDSDVPVTYCGWNAFEIMRPPRPTANKSDVLTAFISNCNDKSKRLDVIDALAKSGEGLAVAYPFTPRCPINPTDSLPDRSFACPLPDIDFYPSYGPFIRHPHSLTGFESLQACG
jgi:hypothetical protein